MKRESPAPLPEGSFFLGAARLPARFVRELAERSAFSVRGEGKYGKKKRVPPPECSDEDNAEPPLVCAILSSGSGTDHLGRDGGAPSGDGRRTRGVAVAVLHPGLSFCGTEGGCGRRKKKPVWCFYVVSSNNETLDRIIVVCSSEAESTTTAQLAVCSSEAESTTTVEDLSSPLAVCSSEAESTATVEDLSSPLAVC